MAGQVARVAQPVWLSCCCAVRSGCVTHQSSVAHENRCSSVMGSGMDATRSGGRTLLPPPCRLMSCRPCNSPMELQGCSGGLQCVQGHG